MLARTSARLSVTTKLPTTSTLAIAGIAFAGAAYAVSRSSRSSRGMSGSAPTSFSKGKSEDEWRAVLSKEQFRILRQKGTEMAGTGEYDSHYPKEGIYTCAGCDAPLYKASHKFKSGCGCVVALLTTSAADSLDWPAYFDSVPGAVDRHEDRTFGMTRIEITCHACGGHLGHMFVALMLPWLTVRSFKGEGFDTPTDERHCVNSVSLKFSPDDKAAA